jgi:hypothetical protein
MKTGQPLRAQILTLLAVGLIMALPLLGVGLASLPIKRYLEFPPQTHYVEHAGFTWPVFVGLGLLILFVSLPFIIRILFANRKTTPEPNTVENQQLKTARLTPELVHCSMPRCDTPPAQRSSEPGSPHTVRGYTLPMEDLPPGSRRFPIWGWIGVALGIGAWILAWSRFEWFAAWQAFTFSPLWFGYIITVNALTCRRTGQCMLTDQPRFFLMLFPVSAAFWWLFEYLNRFAQNWYYIGVGALTPLEYFLFATLPFATVLPAVMGTYQLLATYPRLYRGLTNYFVMPQMHSQRTAIIVFILAAAGLTGIGIWPDYLFPLLWLAPLGVLASLQTLAGRTALFSDLINGDWRRIVLLALAALICGIFWEMWNFYSAAKWIYAVPFVNRFHIFEMPVLGYAGYLPFGLECALIADLLCSRQLTANTHKGAL